MAETVTIHQTKKVTQTQVPWNVIVHDDPVNLMGYVTFVLMKIFGYNEPHATRHMLEIHEQGLSVVWSGELEKAEFYAQQLQLHQLKTSLAASE
jgi:ATP-dependent Clp protease adaptor protein ClpS